MYNEIAANKRRSVFLIVFFFLFIIGLAYLFGLYYGDYYSTVVLAVIISLVMTLVSYFSGDSIALSLSGSKQISREDNPYLYNMVENLCIASGTPVPKIHIMEESAINAFATGRKPETASISVTRGALEKLENEELEGVLAHELSHIKNYDIRFMMLVAVLVGTVSILADILFRTHIFGGRKRENNGAGILGIIGIVLALLSPLIAELIKLAVSRQREYLADASGSLLTRYPEGLARALEKIGAENQPLTRASSATAHLFLANPFGSSKLKSVFSTHPPVEERVKRLRGMGA